jgi:hypothetical protein
MPVSSSLLVGAGTSRASALNEVRQEDTPRQVVVRTAERGLKLRA